MVLLSGGALNVDSSISLNASPRSVQKADTTSIYCRCHDANTECSDQVRALRSQIAKVIIRLCRLWASMRHPDCRGQLRVSTRHRDGVSPCGCTEIAQSLRFLV